MAVQRRFTTIDGGARPGDRLVDLRAIVDDYLQPSVSGLEQALDECDLAAVRIYAHEVIVVAGSVIAACPRPAQRGRNGEERPELDSNQRPTP